jgi:hypothetical protein
LGQGHTYSKDARKFHHISEFIMTSDRAATRGSNTL